jgi:hypothetical protein
VRVTTIASPGAYATLSSEITSLETVLLPTVISNVVEIYFVASAGSTTRIVSVALSPDFEAVVVAKLQL